MCISFSRLLLSKKSVFRLSTRITCKAHSSQCLNVCAKDNGKDGKLGEFRVSGMIFVLLVLSILTHYENDYWKGQAKEETDGQE